MKYHLQGKQLDKDEFCLFLSGLSRNSRWVVRNDQFPWVEIVKSYKVGIHNGPAETGSNPIFDSSLFVPIQKHCHKAYLERIKHKKKSWKRVGDCKSKGLSYLPIRIYADKICLNCTNRALVNELEIEFMRKPLDRPSKNTTTEYKSKIIKAIGDKNEVEIPFGTGKRVNGANNIRTKWPETAKGLAGACYYVKNVE